MHDNELILSYYLRGLIEEVVILHTKIQYCIDECTKSAQIIRHAADNLVDHRGRLALAEANRYMEMCIHGCLDAKEMAKQQNMAGARS